MKAKLKDKPLNSILDVNIGMPSLSETGVAAFTAVNVLAAYEKQAADILKRDGYPPTIEELWNKKDELLPDLANGKGLAQVYSIFWMLCGLKRVQIDIEKNNADMAVCDMAYAVHWAIRAQLKPIALYFDMGKRKEESDIDSIKTREIKKRVMRRAIKNIFIAKPKTLKTLGDVWNKFDVVNKNIIFEGEYKVKKGKDKKKNDVVIITKDDKFFSDYAKRSLQHFIDALK